jgi:hypothetical protein
MHLALALGFSLAVTNDVASVGPAVRPAGGSVRAMAWMKVHLHDATEQVLRRRASDVVTLNDSVRVGLPLGPALISSGAGWLWPHRRGKVRGHLLGGSGDHGP